MAIETVDFPMKHGDFPWQNISLPEGTRYTNTPQPTVGNAQPMFD